MKAAVKPIHTKIIHWAEMHELVRAVIFCRAGFGEMQFPSLSSLPGNTLLTAA
jgi:hypothetical protein